MLERTLWRRPVLRRDEDEHKHRPVTWLELFFDLFFVVVIAQVTHVLAGALTLAGIGSFVLLFLPVWMIWIGITYYTERFETEGVEQRIFFFLLMIPSTGLAAFAHDALGETFTEFALSYLAARLITTVLWLRAGRFETEIRPTALRFGFSMAVTTLLVLGAVWAEAPGLRYTLFGIAVMLDVAAPVLIIPYQQGLPSFSTSKLPERFGLFTIIVLGETVAGVINGLGGVHHVEVATALSVVLGLAIGLGLWWTYFDFVARRPCRKQPAWTFLWTYLHLPLVMSIAAAGAGLHELLLHAAPAAGRLLAGAVALALATMGLLEWTLHREPDEPSHPWISPGLKLFGALVAAVLAWGAVEMQPVAVLALLLLPIATQVAYAMWAWTRRPEPEAEAVA